MSSGIGTGRTLAEKLKLSMPRPELCRLSPSFARPAQGSARRPVGDGLIQHAQVGLVEWRGTIHRYAPLSVATVGNSHSSPAKMQSRCWESSGAGGINEIIELQGLGQIGLTPDFAGKLKIHPGQSDGRSVNEPDAKGGSARRTGGEQAQRALKLLGKPKLI